MTLLDQGWRTGANDRSSVAGWAWLPVAVVMGPVLAGLCVALAPALDSQVWTRLWADNQWPAAVRATCVSAAVGTGLACALTSVIATSLYPSPAWQQLQRQLSWMLAVPHAAFAVGLFFLLAPSGWLARAVAPLFGWLVPPDWVTVQDPHGLTLALALAIKESWFLLWVLMALVSEQSTSRQLVAARSLGYGRAQAWRVVVWPQLVPRMAWPLAAVLAYSLSVVDMAVVLGPANPPTLAVLAWRWLTDADATVQAMGAAAALVLLLLFVCTVAAARWVWAGCQHWHRRSCPSGVRRLERHAPQWGWMRWPLMGSGAVVLVALGVWSVADGWFFPQVWPQGVSVRAWGLTDWRPLFTTLWLGIAASLVALPAALLWLEWSPPQFQPLVYLPLVLPALPLAAGQYVCLLYVGLDGTGLGVVWSHLLWVLPYMVLTLAGAHNAFDPRLMTTARALGQSHWQACVRVKWPLMFRPMAAALAVGFAVSVAQYVPTLFAGGGRFATVTTEALTLSAGGNRSVLAVQALLQVALPLAAYAVATALPLWLTRNRVGMR